MVVSLLGGGTVVAAAESLPDQPLYAVKLAAERVQVALTPLEERRFDVLMNQSDRRLLEATAMAMAGKYERAYQALLAYEGILRDMERAGLGAANRGRDIAPPGGRVREPGRAAAGRPAARPERGAAEDAAGGGAADLGGHGGAGGPGGGAAGRRRDQDLSGARTDRHGQTPHRARSDTGQPRTIRAARRPTPTSHTLPPALPHSSHVAADGTRCLPASAVL